MTPMQDERSMWRFFETMLRIRRLEETVATLGDEKAFPGHYHLYIGQEATGVGAMAALDRRDRITTTHRNHGHLVSRGASSRAILAEILGKETGLNHGRGGTLHLSDPDLGFLQTSAMVGGAVALAVGGGFACKQLGQGAVTACFFGDGALEEGICFETMNMAALWRLPIVYVCENNSQDSWGMAVGGYPTLIHAANDLKSIPGSLGIDSVRVEGCDPIAVNEAMKDAVRRCRIGQGPVFIEAMTRRWAGSAPLWPELVTGITNLEMAIGPYEIGEIEHKDWFAEYDPVLRCARKLMTYPDESAAKRIRNIDAAVKAEIKDAKKFALASPFPPEATAADYVFSSVEFAQ